jgi:16S rRNA (cytosine967-C5)-methyltransferase
MRHDARYGTAIGLLDRIFAGEPAEKVLTNWARANRYAGSKDRAAVRDIVFDALRGRNHCQALGRATDGRGTILGQVIGSGQNPDTVFTGLTHAPDVLSPEERAVVAEAETQQEPVYDVPGWLVDQLKDSLGADFERTMAALRDRAPVDLRVNLLKATVAEAAERLAADGVQTIPLSITPNGLRVTEGDRKVAQSGAYQDGMVELQDAGSQAVVDSLPLRAGLSVLDYCAGGGGKSLAMASVTEGKAQITAFDKSANRLKNLQERADRAGAKVTFAKADPAAGNQTYDLVLLDVPCSGSGAWRRNPDSKWKFTTDDLEALTAIQGGILKATAKLVRKGGTLAYVTCSLLRAENEDRIAAFLAEGSRWTKRGERRLPVGEDSDGFFLCLLEYSDT